MGVPGEPRDGGQYSPSGSYPQYQPPTGGEPYPTPPRNGFGVAALVLGLLAVVLFWTVIGGIVLGILALIFGLLGRARAKRGEATNGGMSIAGVVLGALGLLIPIGLIIFGVSLLNSPAARDYYQCVEQASGDQVRIQECATEFGRQFGGG